MSTSTCGTYRTIDATDLVVGDFVLADRITGWLRINALIGRGSAPVIRGVDADGRTHEVVPTSRRVSAWVAHRNAAPAGDDARWDGLTARGWMA